MSRGFRNCNPGNIRRSNSGRLYLGELNHSTDKDFRQFRSMEWGYRAIFVLLYTYHKRYKLSTCRKWISRWAPPSENNTSSYIDFVCRMANLQPDKRVEPTDKNVMIDIVRAITLMENGEEGNPEDIVRGWELFAREYIKL